MILLLMLRLLMLLLSTMMRLLHAVAIDIAHANAATVDVAA
jgi:hypothetical protein